MCGLLVIMYHEDWSNCSHFVYTYMNKIYSQICCFSTRIWRIIFLGFAPAKLGWYFRNITKVVADTRYSVCEGLLCFRPSNEAACWGGRRQQAKPLSFPQCFLYWWQWQAAGSTGDEEEWEKKQEPTCHWEETTSRGWAGGIFLLRLPTWCHCLTRCSWCSPICLTRLGWSIWSRTMWETSSPGWLGRGKQL